MKRMAALWIVALSVVVARIAMRSEPANQRLRRSASRRIVWDCRARVGRLLFLFSERARGVSGFIREKPSATQRSRSFFASSG
jgi:hypothetical protein